MKPLDEQLDARAFPELLAAYADGELDAASRARVEAWLTEHPEAHPALEAQRQLSQHNQPLWQESAGPAPTEARWARLYVRVQDTLAAPPANRRLRFRLPLSAAAAALLAVALLRMTTPPGLQVGRPAEDVAWEVAGDRDVEIVSMLDGDTDRLVVGRPPLAEPIVLASSNDVTFENVTPDADGMMPQMPPPGAAVPMIVAPLGGH